MPSCSSEAANEIKMPFVGGAGGGSFGKASISSGFSGTSDRDSHIDSILKTIAKDSAPTSHSLDYSVNDANSIRLAINKTSELDSSAGPLKKMSEKPNNQTAAKLVNTTAVPLSPSLIKCNILKARSDEDAMPTKLTNQLFQQYPGAGDQPPSLESATFVSVVSNAYSCV